VRSKNRVRKVYKGYDKALKPFKIEMIEIMENNRALAFAICETWRADKYKTQYHRTTRYFGINHRKAFSEFCLTEIPGEVLCGRDEFWLTLRLCGHEDIYEKYKKSIPEDKAFGLIFKNALDIVNKRF